MVTSTTSHSHGHELPQEGKIIKADDEKIFSKLFSKENSSSIMATTTNNNNNMNSSSRVYYGGSAGAAIPFMWESAPGTPKHTLSNTSLPPLTPPPSYHSFNSNNTCTKLSSSSSMKKHSRHNLLYTIFPSLISRKKTRVSPPLSSSSSSPSYSSSSSSSNSMNPNSRGRYFATRPPIYFGFDDQEKLQKAVVGSSPTSTLCFGGFRACFRWSM